MENFDLKKFCDRFNSLIDGESQLELSKAMGLSQPVISKLKKGIGQSPSADTIVCIANYFNVSTDWLLGLSDVKTTDKATKELCDTLGLANETIEALQDETDIYAKKAIDWLVTQHINSIKENYEQNLEFLNYLKDDLNKIKCQIGLKNALKNELKNDLLDDTLDNSILCNIYRINELKEDFNDVEFDILRDGTINMRIYSDEILNASVRDVFSKINSTPTTRFSYKKIVVNQYKDAIIKELTSLTDTIIDEQSRKNSSKYASDALKRLLKDKEEQEAQNDTTKKEAQSNGNDTKA